MILVNEKRRITKDEILELLKLRGWFHRELAEALGVCRDSVEAWLSGRRKPSPPAALLMLQWLDAARGDNHGRKPA